MRGHLEEENGGKQAAVVCLSYKKTRATHNFEKDQCVAGEQGARKAKAV